jgi:hypothetical protein
LRGGTKTKQYVGAAKTKRKNARIDMLKKLVPLVKAQMIFFGKAVTIPMVPWNNLKIRKDLMAKAAELEIKLPNGYISIKDFAKKVEDAANDKGEDISEFMKKLKTQENKYSVISLFSTSLILLANRCPAGKTLLTPFNELAKAIWGKSLIEKVSERVKNQDPEELLDDSFFDDEAPDDSFFSDAASELGIKQDKPTPGEETKKGDKTGGDTGGDTWDDGGFDSGGDYGDDWGF